jgi:hypothetical protein
VSPWPHFPRAQSASFKLCRSSSAKAGSWLSGLMSKMIFGMGCRGRGVSPHTVPPIAPPFQGPTGPRGLLRPIGPIPSALPLPALHFPRRQKHGMPEVIWALPLPACTHSGGKSSAALPTIPSSSRMASGVLTVAAYEPGPRIHKFGLLAPIRAAQAPQKRRLRLISPKHIGPILPNLITC